MEQSATRSLFEVYTGHKLDGKVINAIPAGHAVVHPGTNFYVVKLWTLYYHTYYLSQNFSDPARYTLFAKKIDSDCEIRFQNPVGTGLLQDDLKTHLEIRFRFPRQSLFMSLFPKQGV